MTISRLAPIPASGAALWPRLAHRWVLPPAVSVPNVALFQNFWDVAEWSLTRQEDMKWHMIYDQAYWISTRKASGITRVFLNKHFLSELENTWGKGITSSRETFRQVQVIILKMLEKLGEFPLLTSFHTRIS